MSTPTTRKTYTRRNTRTRLIDLLKEAIDLVEKGCPPGHMTRGPTSVLPTLPLPATAKVAKTNAPLSAIAEENLRTQANSLLVASQVELEKGRAIEAQAQSYMNAQGIVTQKKKGTVRPGVLKYNEFVKDWISKHPEYQAKGKYQAALKEIQRSGNWDRVSGTRKKVKTAAVTNATPARVSPALPLRNQVNSSNTTTANSSPSTANSSPSTANSSPSTAPLSATPANVNATPANATPANATSYTNEGINDTVGMRKISMNGRSLYMSSDNALFERDGDAPGDFIGRLVDGKIVEEEAPELPEYS